ncbi:MAG: stalk domain-containing protein [Clostridiales bacterium]|nr:stalk domain-containing protein [Clostridiales bacterium]
MKKPLKRLLISLTAAALILVLLAAAPLAGQAGSSVLASDRSVSRDIATTLDKDKDLSVAQERPIPDRYVTYVKPYIIQHPSDVTTSSGMATFRVEAGGTGPLSYQWQVRDSTGRDAWRAVPKDTGVYSGGTTPILSLSRLTSGYDGGVFRCEVSSSYGTVYSNEAVLTITSRVTTTDKIPSAEPPPIPEPPHEPEATPFGMTGPKEMGVYEGYAAFSTDPFTIYGDPLPTVTLYSAASSQGGKITWNDETQRLDIAAGLPEGIYAVELLVSRITETNPAVGLELFMLYVHGLLSEQSPVEAIVLVFTIGENQYTINGVAHAMDAVPVLIDGRTFLPIRYITEPFGATSDWTPDERKVTITHGEKIIELWIDNPTAAVNGVPMPVDSYTPTVAPMIINGRTYLPMRFIGEIIGCTIDWDGATMQAILTYQP